MTLMLDDLQRELVEAIRGEVKTTLRVAVCKTAKMPRAEMLDKLGITDAEARMCEVRIGSVVAGWR